jgi:hypothetical protein
MVSNKRIDEITRMVIKEELNKNDVESIVSRKLSSSYDSRDFKKAVKEITAEVIEDLYRTLWNRSSSWKGGITR